MSNIDFDIGNGNPAAVAIRFHVAQHCFLTHMDFHINSGLAALKDVGNEAEDLHFYGGDYGIVTIKPSPGWQFTLLDSTFEGQRKAAISEHEAGLTLDHDTFRNVPAAIDIDPHYYEELWVKNSRFENISGPAITISNENNPRTEINLENIACHHVPVFALLRDERTENRRPGRRLCGQDLLPRPHHPRTRTRRRDPHRASTRTPSTSSLPRAATSSAPSRPPIAGSISVRSA